MNINRLRENYKAFEEESLKMVNKVAVVTTNRISDNPKTANKQMRFAEGYYWYMQTLLALADYWLDAKEVECLPKKSEPKTMGSTDFDRKYLLQGEVSNQRFLRNLLKNQVAALEVRINTCQTHLKYNKEVYQGG